MIYGTGAHLLFSREGGCRINASTPVSAGAIVPDICIDFDFATFEVWIPDTLRSLALAHEVGNDDIVGCHRQSSTSAVGMAVVIPGLVSERKRAESVGNRYLGLEGVKARAKLATSQCAQRIPKVSAQKS
ncbi:hypothetical protein [Kumtagia ephedrae]|uniref:hypothetical protein n=1 Tax=Kumtagia ephedrae TaxID=2116701 RepID=UPI0014036780|nr:hypothetical protein [Mesorhizobium ephedrae]